MTEPLSLDDKAAIASDRGPKPKTRKEKVLDGLMFHDRTPNNVNELRRVGAHPSERLRAELAKRKWSLEDLSRAIPRDGHSAVTELKFTLYLADADSERGLRLGFITCAALDHVFNLPNGTFRKIEKAWCEANGLPLI